MPLDMMLRFIRGAEVEHRARDHEGNLVLGKDGKPLIYTAPLDIKFRLQLCAWSLPYTASRLPPMNPKAEIDLTSIPNELLELLRAFHQELVALDLMGGRRAIPARTGNKSR